MHDAQAAQRFGIQRLQCVAPSTSAKNADYAFPQAE